LDPVICHGHTKNGFGPHKERTNPTHVTSNETLARGKLIEKQYN